MHVSNATNVTARISANIQSDGSMANTASGVFVQNVTPTGATTASVNIGTDSNVLGALARRGATTYTGATLLISATGCTDCITVALTLSITNGGAVTITYNGAAGSDRRLATVFGGGREHERAIDAYIHESDGISGFVQRDLAHGQSDQRAVDGIADPHAALFAAGLPTGPNSATVTISAGGISTNIPILFNVGTSSGLTLSPNPMNFQYVTSTSSFHHRTDAVRDDFRGIHHRHLLRHREFQPGMVAGGLERRHFRDGHLRVSPTPGFGQRGGAEPARWPPLTRERSPFRPAMA